MESYFHENWFFINYSTASDAEIAAQNFVLNAKLLHIISDIHVRL